MIQQSDTALCEACHEFQTEVLDYHGAEFLYFVVTFVLVHEEGEKSKHLLFKLKWSAINKRGDIQDISWQEYLSALLQLEM